MWLQCPWENGLVVWLHNATGGSDTERWHYKWPGKWEETKRTLSLTWREGSVKEAREAKAAGYETYQLCPAPRSLLVTYMDGFRGHQVGGRKQ